MLAAVGAAGATGGLAACAPGTSESPKSPVKLGLLVPATGVNKGIGADLENGFKLYLEQHEGKFAGHPIDLVIADEGDQVKQGTDALQELHKQSVAAVVGVANPDLLPAVRDLVEKSQIPLIAAHGSSSQMASAVYIWRTAYVNNEPGRALGIHLKGKGNVALVALQDSFGKDVMAGFSKEFGQTITPVWVAPTGNPSRAHLANAIDEAMNSGVSAIFCYFPPAYLIPFMEGLASAGNRRPVYAPGVVSEGVALEQLAGAKDLYTAMQYSSDLTNEANRTFSSVYQRKFSRSPTAYAVAAYDAAFVLDRATALIGDGSVSPIRLNAEISKVGQIISPRGNWQFTQSRAPQQKWYLRQVRADGPIMVNKLVSELTTLDTQT
ncbi:ABC transporter substrate-binding protein [Allorhizocola rhizosphaerae]|uniref:ABC transporter substrate-binding protein n=1 Tax=Allorhizocola rhizosphaerae TaxID=1872709 RepID=UPI0013C33299|nr:ABC transporter substrate-binding protein [Allorhizocola rhizosphaerae]